jgi:hypothetical protein
MEKNYGKTLSDVSRPKNYRAPSWSWASIDAGVLFIQMNFDHIVAEFRGAYIEPAGKDMSQWGMVKAGWLRLWVGIVSFLIYASQQSDSFLTS